MVTDITPKYPVPEGRVATGARPLAASHVALENAYQELKTSHHRMLQQEKMASIGQLAAGVAHEINNPLAYVIGNLGALDGYVKDIGGFLRALEETIQNSAALMPDTGAGLLAKIKTLREAADIDFILEDIEEIVAESLEGSDRMKQIVQNLKGFDRLNGAAYKMADLNAELQNVLNTMCKALTYETHIKKSYGSIPRTWCNPSQLNQAFTNLLLNAAEAIEGRGRIDIQTRREAGRIVIEIADTGRGIPEDQLNKIFDPFFTTKEVGKGTGLGLSIAYDIVGKHGGTISVQSQPEAGTRFRVSLPIHVGNGEIH
ncbi:MAG: ATP-binding protein [Desulfosarcinaceae bacterium]